MQKRIATIFAAVLLLVSTALAQNVNLTLKVNMALQIKEGNFNPASDVVRCAGSFQGWSPADAPDMTDTDGDSIYVVTYNVPADSTYEYKFVIGTDWGNNEDNNRSVTVGSTDMTVDVVWYNNKQPMVRKEITVVYTCNMELERLSGRFNPATDTVELRGVEFGWGPGVMMTQSTINPDYYEYTATQSLGVGEEIPGYKFWYKEIWEGGDNRTHTVTQEEFDNGFIEITRGFNDLTLDNVINQPCTVTFKVNTAGAISAVNNQPFPVVNTVHITGAVPPLRWPNGGWPNDNIDRMIQMYDDGTNGDETAGDGIFTVQIEFPAYSPLRIQYKYGINYGDDANNGGGNDNENGVGADHFITLQYNYVEATVENVFGTMGDHQLVNIKKVSKNVDLTLQVNMALQIKEGNFNPASDVVRCAGSFQGWSPADAPDMTDADGDSIYVVTYNVPADSTYEYKFVIGTDWGNNEDNNRSVTVGSTDMTVDVVWYNNKQPMVRKEITVVYTCNMELERLSGRFNPATDTVELRGVEFGWGPGVMMTQSTINPDYYEYTATQSLGVGEEIPGYKFWYKEIWEGGDNRTHTVTQEEYDNGFIEITRGFNDLTLDNVINQPCTVTFKVNTAGAISAVNNQPFPVVNTVHITGAVPPLRWPNGGWPNDNIDRMIQMYDDGTNGDETAGDGIFTVQIEFPAYSPLRIQYKYGINYGDDANNGGGNDNENGVGADHFITLQYNYVEATVENVFGTMGEHDLVNVVTGVEEVDGAMPTEYALGQNYPNPFNPSTTINFSLPKSGNVVLKIYNMLGQEVATLVDEYKNAGKYEVNFDASKLSSGIYLYSIQSADFTATRKMILMK